MNGSLTAERACLDCMLAQAERLSQLLAPQVAEADQLLAELQSCASLEALGSPPPLIARAIYRRARERSGVADPYRREKIEATRLAIELLPGQRHAIESSTDPLKTAVQIAIAGNIVDFGPGRKFDLKAQLDGARSVPIQTSVLDMLKLDLARANRVLYLADNAGEAVLDRLLIEQIDAQVTYAVRGAPVINDVTVAEALESGLDQVAEILSTGSDIPGIMLEECSPRFREVFETADVILSKGQGNYESLCGASGPIYFLLVIKCELVASHLKGRVGDCMLLAANPR